MHDKLTQTEIGNRIAGWTIAFTSLTKGDVGFSFDLEKHKDPFVMPVSLHGKRMILTFHPENDRMTWEGDQTNIRLSQMVQKTAHGDWGYDAGYEPTDGEPFGRLTSPIFPYFDVERRLRFIEHPQTGERIVTLIEP
jgi:hypothetical protein